MRCAIALASLLLLAGLNLLAQVPLTREPQMQPQYQPPQPGQRTANWNNPDPRYVPPTPPPPRWRLGLRVQNRDTGAVITQIVPNSAASRAGLEAGDLIINVDGTQVGYVNGQLRDVAEECYRKADANGMVRLLIRNARNGQVLNAPLQLDRYVINRVTGTLATDQPNFFTNSATAVVKLVELSQWNGRPTVVTEDRQRCPGRFPMSFNLEYNPSELDPSRRLGVEAEIVENGRVLFRTRTPYDVPQGGRVDLLLTSTGGPPLPPNPGPNPPWWRPSPTDEIRTWYRRYFFRDPGPNSIDHYLTLTQRGYSIRDIRIQMLASSDFFEMCGLQPNQFVARIHELTRGGPPNPGELRLAMARFDALKGNRLMYVREVFSQPGVG